MNKNISLPYGRRHQRDQDRAVYSAAWLAKAGIEKSLDWLKGRCDWNDRLIVFA